MPRAASITTTATASYPSCDAHMTDVYNAMRIASVEAVARWLREAERVRFPESGTITLTFGRAVVTAMAKAAP